MNRIFLVVVLVCISALAIAQPILVSTRSPLVFALPFYKQDGTPTPRVPIYAVELPNVVAGEIFDVSAQVQLDVRTTNFNYPAFVACMVQFHTSWPYGIDIPFSGKYPVLQSGEDIYLWSNNPYKRFAMTGKYQAAADDVGYRVMVVTCWATSASAHYTDAVNIVGHYGKLDVLRFAP